MNLTELLHNIKYESKNFANCNITGVEHDSRKISDGNIYVCLKGLSFDGHDFAGAACDAGAVCIITEKFIEGINAVQILVQDSRVAYSNIASNWYGNPHEKLKIVAVTGTNGKTTTTQIIRKILETANKKCAILGTLGAYIDGEKYEQHLTTPDPMDFHRLLSISADKNCEYVIMETSAHALYLKKTEPVKFEVGVFTNLTQDHLDDFGTMENYKNAKKLLFQNNKCKSAIINIDDNESAYMIADYKGKVVSYGIKSESNLLADDIELSFYDIKYKLAIANKSYDIKLGILGIFNVLNSLAALGVCLEIGIDIDTIIKGLEKVSFMDGRMESVNCGQEFMVIVDYAHSPDSLKSALNAARGLTQNRVISVFGCGGDRDSDKRPKMGKISGDLADYSIITSDNPRTEDPDSIIDMIERGMNHKEYTRITDRRQAIIKSLEIAEKGDVVIIAGKGHETYQDVMGQKHHFDDREIVKEYFKDKTK